VELPNTHGGGLDWDLYLYFQPANCPDTNINDLGGFFVSMQALQQFQHPSSRQHWRIDCESSTALSDVSTQQTGQCLFDLANLHEPDH
jgi:hypothetical protein